MQVDFISRFAPFQTQQNRSSAQTKERTKQSSASPSAHRRSIDLNVAKNSDNKAHVEVIDPASETFHELRPDTPL